MRELRAQNIKQLAQSYMYKVVDIGFELGKSGSRAYAINNYATYSLNTQPMAK